VAQKSTTQWSGLQILTCRQILTSRLKDHKNTVAGAMAKFYASKTAMEVTVEAVQVHGGYGFVKEYHVERLMRDAKITQIYEGTTEVQKIVISKAVLR